MGAGVGVGVAAGVGVGAGVGVAVGALVGVAVGAGVGEGVGDGVGAGVGEGVAVRAGVAVVELAPPPRWTVIGTLPHAIWETLSVTQISSVCEPLGTLSSSISTLTVSVSLMI